MKTKFLRPQVNTVGLVAHYKLWTGFTKPVVAGVSDGSVFDYSLNGNDGAIDKDNAVTLPAYPGFSFDGASSKITVAANSSIAISSTPAFTIAAWINPASEGGGNAGRVIGKLSTPAGYTLFVGDRSPSTVAMSTTVRYSSIDAQSVPNTKIPINTWAHAIMVHNEDSAKKIKIYFNGVLQALSTNTAGTGTVKDDSAVDLAIGNLQLGTSRTFDGLIDDVMIFNTAKTAAEIKSIYEITKWRYD